MAPLPGITTMQVDITVPETVPHVLEALGGRKADLVVCDGAPDGGYSSFWPCGGLLTLESSQLADHFQ
jgi:23S rRNA U2552 (ribose-2'-O)-methylase RlmE/FtsJ